MNLRWTQVEYHCQLATEAVEQIVDLELGCCPIDGAAILVSVSRVSKAQLNYGR